MGIFNGGGASVVAATGKASRTAGDVTTTSTSFVDLTDMTVTVTTGATKVLLVFTGNGQVTVSAPQDIVLDFAVDGTRQGGTFGLMFGGGSVDRNCSFSYLTDVLTAGSHTFKVQWYTTGGTAKMYASASAPIVMQAVEVV